MRKMLTSVGISLVFSMLLMGGCQTTKRKLPLVMEYELEFLQAGEPFTPKTNGVFVSDKLFDQLMQEKIEHER